MQAARTIAERRIEVREVPETGELAPSEVRIQVGYAGICGSDIHVYRGEFAGRVRFPLTQGHEFAGWVVEKGRAVQALEVGDRVCVDPIISCHRCPACLAGRYNACRSLRLLGIDLDGAFAERVVVDAEQCFRLPEAIGDREAALVELFAIGMHATTRARIDPGDTVVVLGSGRVGLAVLSNLALCPLERLIAVDVSDHKLGLARQVGASDTINAARVEAVRAVEEATGGRGADCVIECIGEADLNVAGGQSPLAQAARMVRSAGRMVVLGQGPHEYGVHWKTLVWKEAELIMSRVTRGEFPRVVALMAAGKFHPELLLSGEYPLAEAPAAFARCDSEPPELVKCLLKIG